MLHVGEVEVRLPWEVDTKYDAGLDDDDDDDKAVAEENKQRLKVSTRHNLLLDERVTAARMANRVLIGHRRHWT